MRVKQEVVIFDFDGTVADSLMASLAVLYEVTHGAPLPKEDISRLRGMTIIRVLHELKVPLWRAVFLLRRARARFLYHMDQVALVPGMDNIVRSLAEQHKLFILSSNNEANVRLFLKRVGLETCFAQIYGNAKPWQKKRALRKLLRVEHLIPRDAWYVGDQIWDIRAAHAVSMRAVAVTWGFSNLRVLKSSRPDALVFTPDELLRCFTNNSEVSDGQK